MNFYTLNAKLIEQNGNIFTYAYAIDDMDLNEEVSGLFTVEENVFYNIPDDLKFLCNTVAEEIISKKIVQLKPCINGDLLGDGIDIYILWVVEILIKERIKTNTIPENLELLNHKRILNDLKDPETLKRIEEDGILSKENIESLISNITKLAKAD